MTRSMEEIQASIRKQNEWFIDNWNSMHPEQPVGPKSREFLLSNPQAFTAWLQRSSKREAQQNEAANKVSFVSSEAEWDRLNPQLPKLGNPLNDDTRAAYGFGPRGGNMTIGAIESWIRDHTVGGSETPPRIYYSYHDENGNNYTQDLGSPDSVRAMFNKLFPDGLPFDAELGDWLRGNFPPTKDEYSGLYGLELREGTP